MYKVVQLTEMVVGCSDAPMLSTCKTLSMSPCLFSTRDPLIYIQILSIFVFVGQTDNFEIISYR